MSELGPMTLPEVLAAREGNFNPERRIDVPDRPKIEPVDERGRPIGLGGSMNVRAEKDKSTLTFDGYATVYNAEYDMYGGPSRYGWTEEVLAGAGKKTLAEDPDVELLINHSGLPLARTTSETLRLSEDKHGLRALADLDPDDPDVARIRPKMERKDVDEMSFAFRIVLQMWNDDYTHRSIVEYSIHRGDVSIVSYGANPHTHADLRSFEHLLTTLTADPDAVMAELRAASSDDPMLILARTRDTLDVLLRGAKPQIDPFAVARLLAEVDSIPEHAPA